MSDTFGVRVKRLRKAAGLKQRETDRLAGLHRGYTHQAEAGHRENPTAETLLAYTALFGPCLEWLGFGLGDPPANDVVVASVTARVARVGTETEAA